MTPAMTEALKAGTEAMSQIKGMLDEMTALVAEITEILEEGQRRLAMHDPIETFR